MDERPRPRPPRPGSRASDREREARAELVEVERAIAALEGRNVDNAEFLLVQRTEAEKRRSDLERIIATSRAEIARRRKLLPIKIAAVLVTLGLVGAVLVPVSRAVRGGMDERDRIALRAMTAAKPFERRLSLAQTEVGTQTFTVATTPGRCFVVVAASAAETAGGAGPAAAASSGSGIQNTNSAQSARPATGAGRVRVERGGDTREAASVGWCACKAEEVRVTASGPEPMAALVLQAPADAVGGADVLGTLEPRPAVVFPETVDRPCAEAAFDAWAASADPHVHDADSLPMQPASLAAQGLGLIAAGAPGTPFVLLPRKAADVCALGVREDGGPLSLRRKGGERVVSAKRGAIGFCAKDASGWSAWGEGAGAAFVLAGPRSRVGGLIGLRDLSARAGLPVALWAPPEELEEDARDALHASGVPATLADLAPNRPAVISISADVRSTLTASDSGREVVCRPALDVGSIQTLCLEARAGAFAPGAASAGIARGPQPLWLALPPAPDVAALERALEVMAFARRMSGSGFELTSLVGATFTPGGIRVTGRNGEKEIVAIVVSSTKPYLHTLSAAAPWTLDAPEITPLAPSDVLELRATPKLAPGRAPREFIIWRR